MRAGDEGGRAGENASAAGVAGGTGAAGVAGGTGAAGVAGGTGAAGVAGGALAKYLRRDAENSAALALLPADRVWDECVIMPVWREPAAGLVAAREALAEAAHAARRRTLLIVVPNHPADRSDAEHACPETALGIRALLPGPPGELGTFVPATGGALLDLLILGPSSGTPLPPKQGVGAARRMGMDAALRLHARGALRSRWLRCTDADARMGPEALCADVEGAAGLALPFVHDAPSDADAALREAIRLYDLHLRWYAAGLRWAGSPWAWIPIGSAMAADADAYAQVRGMPRRAAGEDFALLAKLELVGGVATPDVTPVRVLGRPSTRVPFGTGPAVARIAERIRGGTPVERAFRLHDPRVFEGVRTWQRTLAEAARTRTLPPLPDPLLCAALDELGLRASAQAALGALPAGPVLERRLRAEFSALRTLRLVHLLRDARWPDLPWPEALSLRSFP